jgi:type II secretory ATPase GspE/PulE/Tfp pilus assembly ATPase PilB-like protein
MIVERKDAQAIKSEAIKTGFKTLQSNAVEQIISGITTIEEILRVTQKENEI